MTVRATPNPLETTANLRAPLVIHEGRGFQVLNEAEGAELQAPLFELAAAPGRGRRRPTPPERSRAASPSLKRRPAGEATGACFIIGRVLILTRRPGERVVIGEDILIEVMGVSGHTVRLGISAPDGVSIYREEIWLAVKEENRAAASADPSSLPTAPPEGAEAPPGGRQRGSEGPAGHEILLGRGVARTYDQREGACLQAPSVATLPRAPGRKPATAAVRLVGEAEWVRALEDAGGNPARPPRVWPPRYTLEGRANMPSKRSVLARRGVRISIAALASLAALLVFATGAMAHKGVEHVFIVSQSAPPEGPLPSNVAYFTTIQAAVNATAANEYDWILVEPGVYDEEVKVTAAHAGIHIRGMNRNTVILDGQSKPAPNGSNGILVEKANNV